MVKKLVLFSLFTTVLFSNTLTPLQLYEMALIKDRDLKNAELTLESARKERASGFGSFLPSVDVEIEEQRVEEFPVVIDGSVSEYRDRRRDTTVTVTQPIYKPTVLLDYEDKDYFVQKAVLEKRKAESQLILKVVEAYAEHTFTSYKYALLQKRKENYKRIIKQSHAKRENGLIAEVDYLEALALNSKTSVQLNSAMAAHQLSKYEIKKYVDSYDFDVGRYGKCGYGELFSNDFSFWEEKISNNYDYKLSVIEEENSFLKIDRARKSFYPTLDFSYEYTENDIPESEPERTASLTFSMNLFSGFKDKRNLEKTKVDLNIAQNRRELLNENLRKELTNYFYTAATTVESLKNYSAVINSKRRSVEAIQVAYKLGRKTIVDLLEAKNELFDSLLEFEDMRKKYVINSAKLHFLVGALDEDFLRKYQNIVKKSDK